MLQAAWETARLLQAASETACLLQAALVSGPLQATLRHVQPLLWHHWMPLLPPGQLLWAAQPHGAHWQTFCGHRSS